jgi:hypothetical protein
MIITRLFLVGVLLFTPNLGLAQNLGQKYEQLLNPLPTNELICYTRACDLVSLFLLIINDILHIIPIMSVVVRIIP